MGPLLFPHDPIKETALDAAFIVKTMAESSQEADAFAFWCLSDIYDQAGVQSSEFQGNYGMLSLHGLRKPAWMAHQLLNRLASERVPVTGGDELFNAVATRDGDRAAVLVYAYPEKPDWTASTRTVGVAWPFGQPTLTRLGAAENNVIATWRGMGAPAYPTLRELEQLRASNLLQTAPEAAVRMESGSEGPMAVFEMECPGVALLCAG